jgi:hypothetical protein
MRLNGITVTAFIKSHLRVVAIIPDGVLRYDGKQLRRGHFEPFAKQFAAAQAFRCGTRQILPDGRSQGDLRSFGGMERLALGLLGHDPCSVEAAMGEARPLDVDRL